MTEQDTVDDARVPPLNLSKEEAEYLWEAMKREIGSEEVQHSDRREAAESVHSKVKELVDDA